MNRNWERWIHIAIIQHFKTSLEPDLPVHIESAPRRTEKLHQYVEVRIDGPCGNEVSKDLWYLDCTINILVATKKNESDIYKHKRNCGLVEEAFVKGIPVFKYGDGPDDDPFAEFGCLYKDPKQWQIEAYHFGQIRNDEQLMISQIEASYRLVLSL